jgi:hypothetical protein
LKIDKTVLVFLSVPVLICEDLGLVKRGLRVLSYTMEEMLNKLQTVIFPKYGQAKIAGTIHCEHILFSGELPILQCT